MELNSQQWTVDASADSLFDFAYERGWTDGLPIIPPTVDRVLRMIQGIGRESQEVVAVIPPANRQATIEKIAINAVMAGCKPEYMPILVTAVETMAELDVMHFQTATSPVAPLMIVHGPITEKINMNSGTDVFGPGNRANATIGRALRLILINIGGGISGITDKATHGQPGKYTFCIAEHWSENPWPSLHEDAGLEAGSSAVTIFPTTGPEEIATSGAVTEPEALLTYIANTVTRWGSMLIRRSCGPLVVLLAVGHARLSFADRGWSKRDIQEFLFQYARVDPRTLPREILERRQSQAAGYVDGMVSPVPSPEDIHVIVSGGHEAHHIQVLPGGNHWGITTRMIPKS